MDQDFIDTMNEKHMELKDLITEDENQEPNLQEDAALLNQLKVINKLLIKSNVFEILFLDD